MLCDTVTRYTVFMPSQSEMNFFSPLQPSFWSPAESSGKSHHITSHHHSLRTHSHSFICCASPPTHQT
jgi:hypothetical protein